MNQTLHQRAADSCALSLGVALDTLLAPIDPAAPAGTSLRGSGVYHAIAEARRADDHTLPMGAWQQALKQVDWDQVSRMTVDALSHKSKDLQIAAWLLEAQINKNGFAALAASLHVIQQLCHRYWDALYPPLDGNGPEHRANIFHWMNDKLLPALRMVPLAGIAEGPLYTYADWERTRRQDRMGLAADDREGASSADLAKAIGATPTGFYVAMDGDLDAALAALDELTATIAPYFDGHPPSFGNIEALLRQIRALVAAESQERGASPPLPAAAAAAPPAPDADQGPAMSTQAPALPDGPDAIRDRAHAYAVLELAADFLLRAEPHSPVPYLVRRAVSWGRLNANELYEELFVRLGGQLNIFVDVMDLDVAPSSDKA